MSNRARSHDGDALIEVREQVHQLVRHEDLDRVLSWLVDMPIVYGEPPDAWDQLLTDFHRIADQRGAEDPVVPPLREVIAVVSPVVEARHAGTPIEKSAHEDVAHTIAEIGRRIARAEGREI